VSALVLDFGGPVLRTPFEMLRPTERRLGLPDGSLDWSGPFDPAADPLWRQMQDGVITEPEYWSARSDQFSAVTGQAGGVGVPAMMRELFSGPEGEIVRPEAVEAIRTARAAGHQVAFLTNDLKLFHDDAWIARIGVLHDLDALVDASDLGVRKPHPRAFTAVLEALAVPASAAVFVDDQPANVVGGEAAGLVSLLFDVAQPAGSFARALAALSLVAG